ncbi:glutamine-rich protein 1, partial [Silurus meridionalis]
NFMEGSVSFEELVKVKARSIPQHRMKEFLESLASKRPEALQEFGQHDDHSSTQQETNCIYMDSAEVADSLLELACPVRRALVSLNLKATMERHILNNVLPKRLKLQNLTSKMLKTESYSVRHLQNKDHPYCLFSVQVQTLSQQPKQGSVEPQVVTQHQISSQIAFLSQQHTAHIIQAGDLTEEQQQQIQAQLLAAVANGQQIQIQAVGAVSLSSPSSSQSQSSSHVNTTNQTGILQPTKKVKVEQPITVSYSIPGQQLATLLTIPQGQQQNYFSLKPDLVTVECAQLYNTTGTITSPTGETWTIPVYTAPTQQTGFTHIAIQQDTYCTPNDEHNNKLTSEGPATITIPSVGGANGQEEVTNALFPTQLLNGNIQIPITVTGATALCPSGTQTLHIWDPQAGQLVQMPQVIRRMGMSKSESLTQSAPDSTSLPVSLNSEMGLEIWRQWAEKKNSEMEKEQRNRLAPIGRRKPLRFHEDLLCTSIAELSLGLSLMTQEAKGLEGETLGADILYYIFLCIQKYMLDNERVDNIFCDQYYQRFQESLHKILDSWKPASIHPLSYVIPSHVNEEMLWECKQLGAHSPATLLFTLMFFNTKYFHLKTVAQHLKVAFTKVLRHTKKNPSNPKDKVTSIRYLKGLAQHQAGQKVTDDMYAEQSEQLDNPLRCPIKLYDFYLFKCPQSDKGHNDVFYLTPEPVVAPDSPIWYSTQPVLQQRLEMMLSRILCMREIQE